MDQARRDTIAEAARWWESKTCIRFYEAQESDVGPSASDPAKRIFVKVYVQKDEQGKPVGCSALPVGMPGGRSSSPDALAEE